MTSILSKADRLQQEHLEKWKVQTIAELQNRVINISNQANERIAMVRDKIKEVEQANCIPIEEGASYRYAVSKDDLV